MRYIVAVASAVLVLLFLGATTGFGDWPRPVGPLSRGVVGGAIAIGVLIVWEQMYPSDDKKHDGEKARTTTGEFDDAEAVVDEPANPADAGKTDETANLDETANTAEEPDPGGIAHPDDSTAGDDPRT